MGTVADENSVHKISLWVQIHLLFCFYEWK